MAKNRDLIVVGGGPAGTTLAALVKKYNPAAKVLLLEKASFPRHHIGESLLPGIVPVLKELGAFDGLNRQGFLRKVGATFVWGRDRKPWDADFSHAKMLLMDKYGKGEDLELTWQVQRSKYDAFLLQHAKARGVEVVEGARALRPVKTRGRVTGLVAELPGEGERALSCRLLADCSGQQGFMSRFFKTRTYSERLKNVAAYAYFKGAKWKFEYVGHPDRTRVFICSVPQGWLWYIPLSKDEASVGLVSKAVYVKEKGVGDFRAYFFEALRACREVWPLLKDAELMKGADPAEPDKDFFTAGDWSFDSAGACGPGWLAAGDAAFFIDPILSSGVMMAHLSAQRAAHTVNTIWKEGDAALERALWSEYNRYCREVGSTFLALAQYWYHHDPCAQRWWARAKAASKLIASLDLDDEGVFNALVSGAVGQFEQAYADRTWQISGMGDSQGKPSRTWRHNSGRDLPILGLFLQGTNARSWKKPKKARRAQAGPGGGERVPALALPCEEGLAFLPVVNTGMLRPIRSFRFGREDAAELRPRRLLPGSFAAVMDLMDGRRSVAAIKRELGLRFFLPQDVLDSQVEQLLGDLESLGAIEWRPPRPDAKLSTPKEGKVLLALREAEGWLRRGEFQRAEALLTESIKAGRGGAWAHAMRGEARRSRGLAQAALADFDLALAPPAAARRAKGRRAQFLLRDFDASIERGWILDRIFMARAQMSAQAGDWAAARRDAEAALELLPGQPEALRLREAAARRVSA